MPYLTTALVSNGSWFRRSSARVTTGPAVNRPTTDRRQALECEGRPTARLTFEHAPFSTLRRDPPVADQPWRQGLANTHTGEMTGS